MRREELFMKRRVDSDEDEEENEYVGTNDKEDRRL